MKDLCEHTSERAACDLTGAVRSTRQRHAKPPRCGPPRPRPRPVNGLTELEQAVVLGVLRSPEFCDMSPTQVWAYLLDQGRYLCSVSTMYRLLRSVNECRERRRQRTHPARKKRELLATKPLQVWSWDITKLRGPQRGQCWCKPLILESVGLVMQRCCGSALGFGCVTRDSYVHVGYWALHNRAGSRLFQLTPPMARRILVR
jgi:transposase InsO family protein